jgi:hypothetical protein
MPILGISSSLPQSSWVACKLKWTSVLNSPSSPTARESSERVLPHFIKVSTELLFCSADRHCCTSHVTFSKSHALCLDCYILKVGILTSPWQR